MDSDSGKIAIVAFGMEHCRRGVEAHARMLFEHLKDETAVDLIKGSGKALDNEIVLRVPKRNTLLTRTLGKLRGYDIYWEQVFFMIKLSFYMLRFHKQYRLIYTQEYVHLIGLSRLKKFFGWQFKLVYCEGFVSLRNTRVRFADSLQEINQTNFDYIAPLALEAGKPVKLIPHFFDMDRTGGEVEANRLRTIEQFKGNDRLLLYVGPSDLIEKNFIRIKEAVKVLNEGWKLLICGGQAAHAVSALDSEAQRKVMSIYVSHAMMQHIYPMADLFVLPAIEEPFGIAIIEAMGHGIPVLLHDSDHSRKICNDSQQCVDMSVKDAIPNFLLQIEDFQQFKESKGRNNRKFFLDNYTWERLRMDYIDLLGI